VYQFTSSCLFALIAWRIHPLLSSCSVNSCRYYITLATCTQQQNDGVMQPVAKQRINKHANNNRSVVGNGVFCPCKMVIKKISVENRVRGPEAYTKDRPALSSEGAPQKQDRNCQTVIWLWAPDGARHKCLLTDWLTDWPSVAMWLSLNSENRVSWVPEFQVSS
jgi:hypothetical protein